MFSAVLYWWKIYTFILPYLRKIFLSIGKTISSLISHLLFLNVLHEWLLRPLRHRRWIFSTYMVGRKISFRRLGKDIPNAWETFRIDVLFTCGFLLIYFSNHFFHCIPITFTLFPNLQNVVQLLIHSLVSCVQPFPILFDSLVFRLRHLSFEMTIGWFIVSFLVCIMFPDFLGFV